jgi:hypothetical protein
MWKKKPEPEAEIDIEHLPVRSIERRGCETVVSFTTDMKDDYLCCSLDQHQRFVYRVRTKFLLSANVSSTGQEPA